MPVTFNIKIKTSTKEIMQYYVGSFVKSKAGFAGFQRLSIQMGG